MNLAQTMMSMQAAGCSAEQMAAVAADHESARIRRRCERAVSRALFPPQSPVSNVANPDSVPMPVPSGAATAGVGGAKAVGRAALLMAHGLRPAARRIAGRLVEHYNLGTKRCDPSVIGMAQAEDLDPRSVRRALAELEAARLITRVIHGAGRRNSYTIDWAALQAIATASENGALPNPDSLPQTRTQESANPDRRVRLNLRRKPSRDGEGGTSSGPDRRQRELTLLRVLPALHGQPVQERNRLTDGDAVGAAIRGKFGRQHDQLTAMLSAWWGLDEATRTGIHSLADFEAWLRERGPPQPRRAGSVR